PEPLPVFITVLWLVLALTILADICYGQHWSYGLRPGGKRDVEKMKDVLQDVWSLQYSQFICYFSTLISCWLTFFIVCLEYTVTCKGPLCVLCLSLIRHHQLNKSMELSSMTMV
uniref:Progonadoliberin n=1 Tax=Erpetoichthys calabaricus TaxID=27687 RepID=A0A8C4RDH4_ERPCA